MPDIFVSYAGDDRDRVLDLVRIFQDQGWTVWWDRSLRPAEDWSKVIETALAGSRCVVVAWSGRSIESNWVRAEARFALKRDSLVPVLIDAVEPPLEFAHLHASDLASWSRATDRSRPADPIEIRALLDAVGARLERTPSHAGLDRPRNQWRGVLAAAVAAPALLIGFGLSTRASWTSVNLNVRATQVGFDVARPIPLISEAISLSDLGAAGLRRIRLPSADSTYVAGDYPLNAFFSTIDGTDTSTLELADLPVAGSSSVFLAWDDQLDGHTISIEGGSLPLSLALAGRIDVVIAPLDGPALLDSTLTPGRGRAVLSPDSAGLGLELRITTGRVASLAEALPVVALDLFRRETHRGQLDQTRILSTIISGELGFNGSSRLEQLERSQVLYVAGVRGEVSRVDLVDGGVDIRFSGIVSDLATEIGGLRQSLMPNHLQNLWRRSPVTFLLASLLYAGLVVLILRRFRVAPGP
jgi:hypothetical protein